MAYLILLFYNTMSTRIKKIPTLSGCISYNIICIYRWAHGHGWAALREISTPGEIYVAAAVSPFCRIIIIITLSCRCTSILYTLESSYYYYYYTGIIAVSHTRHNISGVNSRVRVRVCIDRAFIIIWFIYSMSLLRGGWNNNNNNDSRLLRREGVSSAHKLTLLNRVFSAFRRTAVATMRFRLESFTYNTNDVVAAAAAAACY